MILFVQPFGLSSPGGGARIMRSLLRDAPMKWQCVVSTAIPVPAPAFGSEVQIGGRPYFARIENSRLARWPQYLDGWAGRNLEVKLRRLARDCSATGIHSIAHTCWDTIAAYRVAQRLRLPFYLTVHDDPAYCLSGHPFKNRFLRQIAEVWANADARYVISEELGKELSSRWGERSFTTVTDGLESWAEKPAEVRKDELNIYFMGLFHLGYTDNLLALQDGMALFEQKHGFKPRLRMRCGTLWNKALRPSSSVEVLPFSDETAVANDLKTADLLYLPLSLCPEHEAMAAYSLSTKMVSYLGSGIPIFFHGPENSAAARLLAKNSAALICTSSDPEKIASALDEVMAEGEQSVLNALSLASRDFVQDVISARFWAPMIKVSPGI